MSELNDSCFVRFYDFFVLQHAGAQEAFLVMDFLPGMPGSSLRDAIRRSAGCGLDFEHVIKAFIRYAHGLKMIHDKGVYHRDIKPTNLYYPEDRPESASIMDLGIARDESGTETTGQVPGTLDYMPPETALGDTRGNAGMDVYALGLCLYEALSGKKGFPRLPTGSQGYAQFFQRAKEKRRPAFDDPRVASHVGLLELLRKMTEPELSDRLADAGQLEHELRNVLEGGSLGAYKPQRQPRRRPHRFQRRMTKSLRRVQRPFFRSPNCLRKLSKSLMTGFASLAAAGEILNRRYSCGACQGCCFALLPSPYSFCTELNLTALWQGFCSRFHVVSKSMMTLQRF
jgi:serine/threonine protein kinase